jgi:hypothetical protein
MEPPEDEGEDNAPLFGADIEELKTVTTELRQKLEAIGAAVVEPDSARHMYVLVASDPFPDSDEVEVRSVDLMTDLDNVPSPIDPSARRFQLVACWRVGDVPSDRWLPAAEHITSRLQSAFGQQFGIKMEYDANTRGATYVVFYLDWRGEPGMRSTDAVLDSILREVDGLLVAAESALGDEIPGAQRATKELWEGQIGMFFAIPEENAADV